MIKVLSGKQFVQRLGKFIEKMKFPASIKTELELELAVLPGLKIFIDKTLSPGNLEKPLLFHHGITSEEKRRWSQSKALQTVRLFGANVSDMFIAHPKIGAVAIEFKYVKDSRGSMKLTSQIQRAVGQSLIATLRHPFAICAIIYKKQRKFPSEGELKLLKRMLWEKHCIYLIIRPQ